jgi:hypothetical protein
MEGGDFSSAFPPQQRPFKAQPLPWHVPGAPAGPGIYRLRGLQRGQRVSERVTGGASVGMARPETRLENNFDDERERGKGGPPAQTQRASSLPGRR